MPVPEGFDVEGRREAIWMALEALEPGEGSKKGLQAWQEAHARWTSPGFLERWLGAFVLPFERGIGRRVTPDHRVELVDRLLQCEVAGVDIGPKNTGSLTMAMELRRLAENANESDDGLSLWDIVHRSHEQWAVQNGLYDIARQEITQLGRALCGLYGGDAVEFALAIGVELSSGPKDEWRVSAGALQVLVKEPLQFGPGRQPRFDRDHVARLEEIGVGEFATLGQEESMFFLYLEVHDLVRRVATDPNSRFRSLVRALLDAERGRIAGELTGQTGGNQADLEYACSVAHEVRNLVLPLSSALSSLWKELGQDVADHARRAELRGRIDQSLDRLSQFARETAQIATAVAPDEVTLSTVVAEAIAATEVDRNGRIVVHPGDLEGLRIQGAARRWTLAFVNLLRNAAQARASKGAVWISTLRDDAGGLHLYVDDDGPGVPEELRERIFGDGHSTRGGSGLGLADARRTAEASGGSLSCAASPRGGARFHFVLPRVRL